MVDADDDVVDADDDDVVDADDVICVWSRLTRKLDEPPSN